jgi:hypothetical protein
MPFLIKFWFSLLFVILCTTCYAQSLNKLNKHGHRTGRWINYADSAKKIKLFEGKFRNGKSIGKSYFYTNDGILDRVEKNRFKKLKTSFYYPNGMIRLTGNARLENLPDKIHYYFYGKWNAYNDSGQLIKYYYYTKGELTKTVYLDKNNKTNDSLIEALTTIDREFTNHNTLLIDSINSNLKNPLKYKLFKTELAQKDSLSFVKIDNILMLYGYPCKTIAGDVSGVPFYILGFAPVWLKEKHLNKLIMAANKEEISWKSLAFFIDKIKIAKGEKQVYGTQYYVKKEEYIAYPIEDMEHLNERRAGVGLEDFEP